MSCSTQSIAERPELGRGSARRRQAVGLSVKICSASAPISWARSTAFTIPPPSGRWAPSRRPSGSMAAIVRCGACPTPRCRRGLHGQDDRVVHPRRTAHDHPGAAEARLVIYRRRRPVSPTGRRISASARCRRALALGVLAADDRLDEPVVAVLALVQDRDPLGLGVHEHEELVAELLHLGERVLLEHRLDREALGLDDPALAAGVRGAVGETAQERASPPPVGSGRAASTCGRPPGARPCRRRCRWPPGSSRRPRDCAGPGRR